MASGSNLTVLPLTVPTTGSSNLSPKTKTVSRQSEYECESYERSLHSPNHHKRIGFVEFFFKYTSVKDKAFYILGLLTAIATGSVIPIINVNFGNMIDIYIQHDQHRHLLYDTPTFLDVDTGSNSPLNSIILDKLNRSLSLNETIPQKLIQFKEKSYTIAFNILAIGFIYFFLCYVYSVLLELASSHMIERIRLQFYKILLSYEVIRSDPITAIDYSSRMENVICKLEELTGEELGLVIYMISCCTFSLISAFYHGWELTLVLLALIPVLSLATTFITKTFNHISNVSNQITYKIGHLVHRVMDGIRIIVSYNNQVTQEMKFRRFITAELAISKQKVFLESFMTASLWLTSYLTFALGVWYAAKLIIVSRDTATPDDDNTYTIGSIVIIFWNVLSVTYFILRIRSNLRTFYSVPFHASTVVAFIDHTSHHHQKGLRPASFNARIRFDNVSYAFQLNPGCSGCSSESSAYLLSTCNDASTRGASTLSSPFVGSSLNSNLVRFRLPVENSISSDGNNRGGKRGETGGDLDDYAYISSLSESLDRVSFTVKEGETVSILGCTGSGISIIGKLLSQFFILNEDIKGDIYLGDNCISSLNREWVKSIIGYVGRDAIIYDGTISQNIWLGDKSCTQGDIVKACERANIAKFIESLPHSYETIVGSKGINLKPVDCIRLALARALVKRPKVLLVDQIFDKISDLDQLAQVVLAVEKARLKLTTVIVTATITKNVKNSDLIVLLDEGQVIELGSHDELFARKGLYKQMYMEQMIQQEDHWINRQNQLNGNNFSSSSSSSPPSSPSSSPDTYDMGKCTRATAAAAAAATTTTTTISQEVTFNSQVQTRITNICDETVNEVIHDVINRQPRHVDQLKNDRTFIQVPEAILTDNESESESKQVNERHCKAHNESSINMKNDDDPGGEDNKDKERPDGPGESAIRQSLKRIYRSPSVRSSISVVSSSDSMDDGESEFYREQRSKSVVEAKFGQKYSWKFLLEYFDFYDWLMLSLGALSSAIFGLGVPVYALIVGEFMTILEYKTADAVLWEAKYVALQFMILSVVISIASFISYLTLGFVHSSLSKKLKEKLFQGILALDLTWFEEKSSVHPHVVKLLFSNEINDVPALITSSVSSYATLIGTVIMCIGYSCYSHWKLALVVLTLMPIIMFRSIWLGRGTVIRKKAFAHTKKSSVYRIIQTARGKMKSSICKSGKKRDECPDMTRVLSEIKLRYEKVIREQGTFQRSNVHVRAQTIALIQCIPVICYGVVYLFGTYFIQADSIHYTELFKIIEGVIFGAILVSEGSFFTLETQSIKNTAGLLAHLLDLLYSYQSTTSTGKSDDGEDDDDDDDDYDLPDERDLSAAVPLFSANGLSLEFRNVCYRLQSPPYTSIFQDFTYQFTPNSYTALFGFSLTSEMSLMTRSAVFSFAQKLIIPKSGTILIDGRDLDGISSSKIRSRISLITSKASFLPECTIGENIALGDPNRFVPPEEIIAICTQLGIHSKITSLANGYESKLTNLTCHQFSQVDKLMLMFARTAIQDAGIILLEQIDHGLSEGTFMTFVDPVIQRFRSLGKTIISIPCGLGTNVSYDTIILMGPNGCILESGSHEHLMSLGGAYFHLYHCYHN